jgi:D-alanyl-D-alanine carboxypeptidase/D-alanyl-D-alanine-endopeptidase (penicillin-binding protein 4)
MNHDSDNFYAEVLGKRLGVETYGAPGTIARGAAAIASWIRGHGVRDRAYDSSGLSYGNRIAPAGVTRLLQVANHEPWGPILRNGLAAPGERGTLKDRLKGIRVRAKTGTLEFVSALSGWVWLRRLGTWAEFSIMSRGMYADQAKSIEDSIVRLTTRYGH